MFILKAFYSRHFLNKNNKSAGKIFIVYKSVIILLTIVTVSNGFIWTFLLLSWSTGKPTFDLYAEIIDIVECVVCL